MPRGYKNIKHGFYKKSILLEKHDLLKRAFIENKIRSEACKWILKHAPNIAKANRNELQRLIYQAESLQKKAKAILIEYDKILRIDDKCKDL